VASRLETLIEQTDFLIEKQKEAQTDIENIFNELLEVVEKKLENSSLSIENKKSLEAIKKMALDRTEFVSKMMQDDIDFLNEQLLALQHITTIDNPTKAKELLNMMIDDNEEILETEEFKKNLIQDSIASKQNLTAVIDDLVSALREDKFKDVELFLEALFNEENIEEEGEGDAYDNSCDSSCKDCSAKNTSDEACPGIDIFKGCCQDSCDDDLEDDNN
jgi:hypothetical protein